MSELTRRNVLRLGVALAIPFGTVATITGCRHSSARTTQPASSPDEATTEPQKANRIEGGDPMKIQYLEIVTPEVDAMCRQVSTVHGVAFGEPDASFGGARIADLAGGGWIGIRGPLRETETPVVRPYFLVEDIQAAVASAAEAGAEIAMPPMEIPGRGLFSIVIQGGIESGFWQV